MTLEDERELEAGGAPMAIVRGRRRYHRIPLVLADRLRDAVRVLEGPYPRQTPGELLAWMAATAVLDDFHRRHGDRD